LLEKLESNDFDKLISWIDSEEILIQFAGSAFSYPLATMQLIEYLKNSNSIIYKVKIKDTKETIGTCEIKKINHSHANAFLSKILIGEIKNRNLGYGHEVVDKLLDICFNELNMHRVELNVIETNHGAIRCYEKSGFIKEGLQRENYKLGISYLSTVKMSILKREYLAKSKNFQL
ncbi:MAG TPA: GNAT family protein, partial [Cytophagaceae bacterium]|nr:GNAT family protein [Cytophagaceae bacterium]